MTPAQLALLIKQHNRRAGASSGAGPSPSKGTAADLLALSSMRMG